MKLSKKIITLIAAVLAFAMIVPSALAVSDASAEAGKTATVTFTFNNIYNVDGEFTVSDPQKILSTYSINVTDAGSTAALVNGNRLWASPAAEPVKTTVSVDVTLNIKSSAAVGSKCTVSFTGIYGDANEEAGNEHDITQSATVSVKAAPSTPPVTPTPTPSTTPKDEPTPSVTPTQPATPSPSANPTTTPSVNPTPTVPSIDYSGLQKQINIASGLIPSDYTDQSREILVDALSDAQAALNSKDQSTVSAAAENLRASVAGLVTMDYSKLKGALSQANALLTSEQTAVLLQELSEVAEQGNELLRSGDQQAVDRAANELTDILDRISALLEVEAETKEVIKEVQVEVLPEGDYCNIPVHHVWPILLVVSATLNLTLIGVIVAYIIRRTKNRRDDTPLVDYDIDDDF